MKDFSPQLATAAEEAHYHFQLGMYISEKVHIDGALLLYSRKIEDSYWNYAAQIETVPDRASRLVDIVVEFYRARDRMPACYVTPWSRPEAFRDTLGPAGFEMQFRDAWMFYEGGPVLELAAPSGLSIKEVESRAEMETFVHVFNEAYGGVPTEEEPYAGLPPYYGEALHQSFDTAPTDKKSVHYLGLIESQPVAIATLIHSPGYACIYNVGTMPRFRRRGIGSTMSLQAVADSTAEGAKVVFLQTEAGSGVEKWYEKLGFSTKFVGEGYVLVE